LIISFLFSVLKVRFLVETVFGRIKSQFRITVELLRNLTRERFEVLKSDRFENEFIMESASK